MTFSSIALGYHSQSISIFSHWEESNFVKLVIL